MVPPGMKGESPLRNLAASSSMGEETNISAASGPSEISKSIASTEARSSKELPTAVIPIGKSEKASIVLKLFVLFKFMGQLCAKALLDGRLIDLHLHPFFWECVKMGKNASFKPDYTLFTVIDVVAARSLQQLVDVRSNGEDVSSLGLDFTLLGSDPPIELIPNGSQIPLTNENLDLYIHRVCAISLYEGVALQVWAFRFGFSTLLPLWSLQLFSSAEIAHKLFCGKENDAHWSLVHLKTFITPDHGYLSTSPSYLNLLTVLEGFNYRERRNFLKFCTGSPVLPAEGFAALRPLMKVVKKETNSSDQSADNLLPSVMTCSNYLKLPNYSSLSALKEKLLYAMFEGQGAFTLS
ncbi:HECT-domain (ubiquitin-transferase) domain-containing protein [Cardiosporidium cionae]|uniref:HECT-domain (Ubiquitin-transferase) domain-containing protein n=1 Tax=Cardiosporidium cionae TaxID=476202 RepID=A0ABQ7J586_9APIC|nr:HECT-domain (ubiquitin-transferase) domain-containing protein [Cardiosporidium cionae]|eukprot:KAF8819176.1 HECT-domain (ubiquitin-transferase) domain-containing protein [Cardiosporidium cionae]